MVEIEIVDIKRRHGVFDVKIINEVGNKEIFTFRNKKFENGKYKEIIKQRVKKRDMKKLESKEECEKDIGTKMTID